MRTGRPRFDHSSLPLPPLPSAEGIEFRHVPELPGYAVDSTGRVWSCKRERCNGYGEWHLVSTTKSKLGRLRVTVRMGQLRQVRLVHHLVAYAFIGPRPENMDILHNDGNSLNNAVANLRYGTVSENMKDAYRHGTHNFHGKRQRRKPVY